MFVLNRLKLVPKIRFTLCAFFLLIISSLFSITITVKQDGTGDYQSIQSAINASQSGDSVLVYPGRYFENVNTNSKNITLASLYARTQDPDYVRQTVIDGNHTGSCIRVMSGETVTIIGFVLTRGSGTQLYSYYQGGGVYVTNESNVTIAKCSIYQNSALLGGGIANFKSTVYLSGNSIFNNKSNFSGNVYSYQAHTIYDPVQLNSIYNNYSTKALDIFIQECATTYPVYLDTLSVQLNSVDGYFINSFSNMGIVCPPFSVSSLHSAFQTINHDLYVAPWGDDDNDGLSPASPLKNIAYAAKIIESDSLNPKTIYLAEGIYTRSLNQIAIPFELKSHTSLTGVSPDNTIIDLENQEGFFISLFDKNNVKIKNISLRNSISHTGNSGIKILRSENITIKNINISHGCSMFGTGIAAYDSSELILEDIVISNNETFDGFCAGILINYYGEDYKTCYLNNIVLDSLRTIGEGGYISSLFICGTNTELSNIIMSNSISTYKGVFQFHNTTGNPIPARLNFSNGLVFNNTSQSQYLSGVLMTFSNIVRDVNYMNVNNLTVANNQVEDFSISVHGYWKMRNMLLYNPLTLCELFTTWGPGSPDIYSHLDIDYSLIKGGFDGIGQYMGTSVSYGTHNIDANPQFLGEDPHFDYPINEAKYYQLSEFSPCINQGTPDTLGYHISATDLLGNHRVADGRIDMGCYEYNSYPVSNDEVLNKNSASLRIYPNPVYLNQMRNGFCTMEFTLPQPVKNKAEIEIFNIKGQKVKTLETTTNLYQLSQKSGLKSDLIDDQFKSKQYSVIWNLKNESAKLLSSGVYICRLKVDGKIMKNAKMTIVK